MPAKFATVDEYIAAAAPEWQVELHRLRGLIRKAVPKAVESVQYNLPFYEYHGLLCSFAAQKNYFSFYVLNGAVVDEHRDLLRGFDVGKGCIRFKRPGELPNATIRALLKAAAASNRAAFNDHC
jgi:uncharacterized protein YdhG (YjbR/CyaY superfamily)